MAREATITTVSGTPQRLLDKADKYAEKHFRGNRSMVFALALEYFFGRKKRAGRKSPK